MRDVERFIFKEVVSAIYKMKRTDNRREIRNALFFATALYTGLRVSDILALKWGDIWDYSKGRPFQSITIVQKKRKVLREVIIGRSLTKDIKFVFEWMKDDFTKRSGRKSEGPLSHHFLFRRLSGGDTLMPMDRRGADKMIKEVATKYKFSQGSSAHSFRKSVGREMFERNGADYNALLITSEALTHKNPVVTLRYIGINKEQGKQTFKLL